MSEAQSIPEAVLEVIHPDGTRHSVRVAQSPFLIGRTMDAGNHLPLSDMRISRQCAALVYAEGEFRLQDRGQRNGIFVNGEKIDIRPLREADTISFGVPDSFQLIFHTGPRDDSLPQFLARMEEASALDPAARDLRHLSLLLEASNLLQSHLPLEVVLGVMLDRAITLTDADRGMLLEADAEGRLRPMLARQRGARNLAPTSLVPSQTVIARAIEKRRSVMEEDLASGAAELRDAQSIVGQMLRSVMAIPLLSMSQMRSADVTFLSVPGQLLGVLYLDSRRPAAFTQLERQILATLAMEAASVLDNARLAKKERERVRLEQELETARQIQQALLPKSFQHFPHLQVTGVNHSCLAVGGDYFDLMQVGPERAAFVIADVCGKGLGAALVTAMLQGTLSALTLGKELACVCAHVNRYICEHSEMQRYATLFFGTVDRSGRLEFINAGHLPPLLVRGGKVESSFPAKSLPVGLFEQTEYEAETAQLEPGDTLVLFTDGVNEASDAAGQFFDMDRLREVVATHATQPVETMQAGILAAVEKFTRGAPQADDITLFILRYQLSGSSN
ncbi:MAG TPA: SpoIIE family protein phosphatase [Candidatus Acidoferrales bacterium]|nr:SpoIIE family protein phosphatase [Candidatus Acidoferrales bacterium]